MKTRSTQSQPSPNDLLDPAGAGEYLGGEGSPIAVATLAEWRGRKFGPVHIPVGRLIRYRRRDLDQWLESRRRT